ncbi:protein-disulfide reductase DsbD [Thiomicrorhabdus heinhorstiae]|uniref:Thiol:disulfide interchange protein DsbD n=1 Tax=Thiomicrorhabdus heinhorstiae TaxID=2748010 RepID=A0ABS0BXS0_9GAMM|nr:protein-disulfide reductase DsbD [Thiomicrorhabdus heinhorstiae]MBF6058194.1 protein-disulfide reductase DsbD [Thiomicrorhabdus heinhorstiae]
MRRAKNITLYLIQILIIAFGLQNTSAWADELLDVDQAFQLAHPTVKDSKIHIEWKIADDYKLYKDKMSVSATQITLQQPAFSKAKTVEDELFGKTEVFTHQATIDIAYQGQASATEVTVKYQGCADKIGVCYPPQTRTFTLDLPQQSAPSTLGALDSFLKQETSEPELLDAEDAFRFSADKSNPANIKLTWEIAHGYHLYQDKIKTKLLKGDAEVSLSLPEAEQIDDPLFGKTTVYHGDLQGTLNVKRATSTSEVQIEYQGCSAEAGVCYPPVKKVIQLDAVSGSSTSKAVQATATVTEESPLSETDQIADTLKNSSVWIVIATFFAFGLLLALTPCVFPMIPILSSIIVGQGDQLTTRKAFIMSLVYVLAMSVTYTVAGVLAGLFGENLQAAFQNPWIIGSFSAIFILLAFSMFGFYELQLPSSLQSKLTNLSNKQQGGTLTGVAVMGFLSALIVGPCVAPPLAGALIYIGQTGDALLGGVALFAMSMGMGLPLLLLGTSAGKLLPRAGAWMDSVKAVFGVALIGVAIWMAERILPSEIILLSWALLFIVSAVYLGSFESTASKSGWFKLFKGIGLALFLYGAMILVGLLGGSNNMLQPLKVFQGSSSHQAAQEEHLAFQRIKSLDDLQQVLASGKPVMLDFYADWCISCKEMEKFTFSDTKVQAALKGVTLIQADVTANDAVDKALMKHFDLIGPPAILFFNSQGKEQKAQRVVGFKNAEAFEQIVKQAF